MGDPFQKVIAGQQLRGISSAAWNTLMDLCLARKRQGINVSGRADLVMPDGAINVRNDSGYDCEEFDVLGLDDMLTGPDVDEGEFKYRYAMRATTPASLEHRGRFVVLVDPLLAATGESPGQIGRAWVAGAVCPCVVRVRMLSSEFPPPGGIVVQAACRVAVLSDVDLTTLVVDAVIDGVTLAAADRVLVISQTDSTTNGSYVIQGSGPPVRAAEFPTGGSVAGYTYQVTEGDYGEGIWSVTNSPGADVVDTDTLTWMQVSDGSYVIQEAVRVVVASNIDLADELEEGDEQDGVTLVADDRVLLTGQTDPAENGVHVVPAAGAASRADDCLDTTDASGFAYYATEGDAGAETLWRLKRGSLVGTDALYFGKIGVQSVTRKARIVDGERGYLEAASAGGADVLWIQPGLGLRWALVRIGNMDLGTVRAVLLKEMESKGVVPAEIQLWDDDWDLWCGTGEVITVRDDLGTGETLPACRAVHAEPSISSHEYLLDAVGCADECACVMGLSGGGCLALSSGGGLALSCGEPV